MNQGVAKGVLFVPLLMAFLWMALLVLNATGAESNVRLSPTKLDAMVNTLFIFIIVYAIFLAIVFHRMSKTHLAARRAKRA